VGDGVPAGPWLCWHNDFITAPPGAEVLARSARATHAYRAGAHLGVQFHPEVTPAIVEDWMRAEARGAEGGPPDRVGRDLARGGVDHDALRAKTAELAPAAACRAWGLF